MGYFKRKLRRRRCAAEIEAIEQAAADLLAAELEEAVWEVASESPPEESPTPVRVPGAVKQERFVRLMVGRIDEGSHQGRGIFRAIGELGDSGRMSKAARTESDRLCRWFNRHLPVPKELTPRAVCWFRAGAKECIDRIWTIVHLLQAYDVPVWMMTTDRPGRVVYEDALQVAAVPFGRKAKRKLVARRKD